MNTIKQNNTKRNCETTNNAQKHTNKGIKIFLKPSMEIFKHIKQKCKSEKGSVTLETALSMPAIILGICTILFAINISMNYLKIQEIAKNCAYTIQVNNNTNCTNLPSALENENTQISVNPKDTYFEINVKKKIFLFPNMAPITIHTQSIAHKT